ncbi:hypothetical protein [Aquimarina sediminis]|uniref:hypothetical protein n=1 Tax=Aquimarina sediminis TaxID=2070536 RepID=UPI000CA0541B|nr:hypothetical protein [Aquimarina sediminis]
MGFGGSVAAMITSLKNNSRRSKREAFDGWTERDQESQGIKVEPVSEEQLQEIRDKLKKQRKKERIKMSLAVLLGIIIAILFIYYSFAYFENDPGISDDFLYRQSN